MHAFSLLLHWISYNWLRILKTAFICSLRITIHSFIICLFKTKMCNFDWFQCLPTSSTTRPAPTWWCVRARTWPWSAPPQVRQSRRLCGGARMETWSPLAEVRKVTARARASHPAVVHSDTGFYTQTLPLFYTYNIHPPSLYIWRNFSLDFIGSRTEDSLIIVYLSPSLCTLPLLL